MHKDGDEIRFGSFNSKALSVDLNLSIDQTSKKGLLFTNADYVLRYFL